MGKPLGWISAAAFTAALTHAAASHAAEKQSLSAPELPGALTRAADSHTGAGSAEGGQDAPATGEQRIAAVAPLPQPKKVPPKARGSDVFGSIAIPIGNIPIRRQWNHAVSQSAEAVIGKSCRDQRVCQSGFAKRARAIKDQAKGLSKHKMIALVNRRINAAITYKADSVNYGRKEHWASIAEVARIASGDCEDYAITKMLMLKSLGIPSKDLSLVGLRDTSRGLYHAVLAVRVGKDFLILDNLTDKVRLDHDITHYQPIFSFTTTASYIHGTKGRKATPRMAAIELGGEPMVEIKQRLSDDVTQRPNAS